MQYSEDKIDEMVLALFYLTRFRDGTAIRAWKQLDWDAMHRLHEKGYTHDPRSKSKSVLLTDEGASLSEDLFRRHFGSK
jgi:hypothetical protein